jgi:hypothetical protein
MAGITIQSDIRVNRGLQHRFMTINSIVFQAVSFHWMLWLLTHPIRKGLSTSLIQSIKYLNYLSAVANNKKRELYNLMMVIDQQTPVIIPIKGYLYL